MLFRRPGQVKAATIRTHLIASFPDLKISIDNRSFVWSHGGTKTHYESTHDCLRCDRLRRNHPST